MRQGSESRPSASRKSVTPDPRAPSGLAPAAQVAFGFQQGSAETVPPGDVAVFIAKMLEDLRGLADKSGLDTLGRFIEVAEREAKWNSDQRREK